MNEIEASLQKLLIGNQKCDATDDGVMVSICRWQLMAYNLWNLKTRMIFGTRRDQQFDLKLGIHQTDIGPFKLAKNK